MRLFGYSTGSLALGNFRKALELLENSCVKAVELSALRMHELVPLVEWLSLNNDMSKFEYISVHAPSKIDKDEEKQVVEYLLKFSEVGWPVVVHPDSIYSFKYWRKFGSNLYIENMDKRKPIGRNVKELKEIFKKLPEAKLCFDIAHARQNDRSMTEAYLILSEFKDRIKQIHLSEVDSNSNHTSISLSAIRDFQEVSALIPATVPVIIESKVEKNNLDTFIENALLSFSTQPIEYECYKSI